MRALAVMAALVAAAPAWGNDIRPDPYSYAMAKGCKFEHRSSEAYRAIRRLVRHTDPTVRKGRVKKWATCLATRAKAHRAHVLARSHWKWRHEYAQRWVIVFKRLPSSDQAWALNTGACESGNNASTNTGNGFHGAFQFVYSTWVAAGGTGSPTDHSWHYQAVVAVRWMHIAGAGQWPVCGH